MPRRPFSFTDPTLPIEHPASGIAKAEDLQKTRYAMVDAMSEMGLVHQDEDPAAGLPLPRSLAFSEMRRWPYYRSGLVAKSAQMPWSRMGYTLGLMG